MYQRIIFFLSYLLIWVTSINAADFQPSGLQIVGPGLVQYDFDGSSIEIPFTIGGTDATVIFSLFTGNMQTTLFDIRNGYLGWHYVNRIDTCMYISQPEFYSAGNNTLAWDGKDNDGNNINNGFYTYYLWACDSIGEMQQAAFHFNYSHGNVSFITHTEDGMPRVNPIIFNAPDVYHTGENPARIIREKWYIGNDPEDQALVETTAYTGWIDRNTPSFVPGLNDVFFTSMYTPDGTQVIRQYRWIPNGEAALRTEWGETGEFVTDSWTPSEWFQPPGIALEGNVLYAVNMNENNGSAKTSLIYIDSDTGTETARVDMTEWWIDKDDADGDGVRFMGPTSIASSDGYLALGSHLSCLRQLLYPTQYYADWDIRVYENGNGDYFGDRNFEETSDSPWICHDANVDAVSYGHGIDANRFVVFPLAGASTASFGLLTPDGTGAGRFPIGGNNGEIGDVLSIIDDDTPYDGIYMDNGSTDSSSSGIRYVAHDSFKGIIAGINDDFGPSHFLYYNVKSTDVEATVIIERVPYNQSGEPFGGDDEIGVFTSSGLCVGFSDFKDPVYKTEETSCIIYGDNPYTSEIDGLIDGEEFKFRIWDWRNDTEYDAQAFFSSSVTTFREHAVILIDSLVVLDHPTAYNEQKPVRFSLSPNYPNPFNPNTTIEFTLPETGFTTLTIYNNSAQKIRELVADYMTAGTHTLTWDGRDDSGNSSSSGVYITRLKAGSLVVTGRMVLMK